MLKLKITAKVLATFSDATVLTCVMCIQVGPTVYGNVLIRTCADQFVKNVKHVGRCRQRLVDLFLFFFAHKNSWEVVDACLIPCPLLIGWGSVKS
jgi:hypothetical protein